MLPMAAVGVEQSLWPVCLESSLHVFGGGSLGLGSPHSLDQCG